MRMWMIDPKLLCRKHLLGEHGEIHKFRHSFVKRHNMSKRIALGQIEPASMQRRHDDLAKEMVRRGFKHQSPYELPDLSYLTQAEREYTVDLNRSSKDLWHRCPDCLVRVHCHKPTSEPVFLPGENQ